MMKDSSFVAQGFETAYGRGVLGDVVSRLGDYMVVANPEPWGRLQASLERLPSLAIPGASELTAANLDSLVRLVPDGVEAVIGIGGARAIDTAKWISWRCGLRLFQMPSLPSVTASFFGAVGLEDEASAESVVAVIPELVLVDFDLLSSAPPAVVRAGIGDVVACHTAFFDWNSSPGCIDGIERRILAGHRIRACLAEAESLAPSLSAGGDEGLARLMACHRDLGSLRDWLGHGRFQEGGEHWFARAFEDVNGPAVMHGELVVIGALIMSAIQGNDPDLPRRIADRSKVRTDLGALGVTWAQVEAALRRLPGYVADHGCGPSVADGLQVDGEVLGLARAALRVGAST